MVFFDTTSLYFEGQGGETMGQKASGNLMAKEVALEGKRYVVCVNTEQAFGYRL